MANLEVTQAELADEALNVDTCLSLLMEVKKSNLSLNTKAFVVPVGMTKPGEIEAAVQRHHLAWVQVQAHPAMKWLMKQLPTVEAPKPVKPLPKPKKKFWWF